MFKRTMKSLGNFGREVKEVMKEDFKEAGEIVSETRTAKKVREASKKTTDAVKSAPEAAGKATGKAAKTGNKVVEGAGRVTGRFVKGFKEGLK